MNKYLHMHIGYTEIVAEEIALRNDQRLVMLIQLYGIQDIVRVAWANKTIINGLILLL